ncbi:alpha-hydroxy acid oxidase [Tepidiphilus olei]|uniref:alpha-hydroxy acid oxidase n=1 Tax=Tepidiphilus olei TaxID=2502184 RepID=UPI00163D8B54|nr:alpha-hydroxy acid oxidase [Tepidiphilus olei]
MSDDALAPVCAEDYLELAQRRLAPDVAAYLFGGAEAELAARRNREALDATTLLPRFVRDTPFTPPSGPILFGRRHASPLLLAPIAHQRLFHPDGEAASVLAALAQGVTPIVSSLASTPWPQLRQLAEEEPLWFQIYWQGDRAATARLIDRAAQLRPEAWMITLDAPIGGLRWRLWRSGFRLPPQAVPANLDPQVPTQRTHELAALLALAPTRDDLAWLRDRVRQPLLAKGVVHEADAQALARLGYDGLVVSNHGGRTFDAAPASLARLAPLAQAVGKRMTILFDGGVRRGSDVAKALALGASAVLVGRPYVAALALGKR